MKFLRKNGPNGILNTILLLGLLYILLFLLTDIFLFAVKIGFSYSSVVEYYLGDEETFKNPVSFMGLLEGTHFHLFSVALMLILLNHLMAFTATGRFTKLLIVYTSYVSGFLNIASPWLIRFLSPVFAYLKIASFLIFHVSLAVLLYFSFLYVRASSNKG